MVKRKGERKNGKRTGEKYMKRKSNSKTVQKTTGFIWKEPWGPLDFKSHGQGHCWISAYPMEVSAIQSLSLWRLTMRTRQPFYHRSLVPSEGGGRKVWKIRYHRWHRVLAARWNQHSEIWLTVVHSQIHGRRRLCLHILVQVPR